VAVNVFAIRHGETAWSLSGQHSGEQRLTDHVERLRSDEEQKCREINADNKRIGEGM